MRHLIWSVAIGLVCGIISSSSGFAAPPPFPMPNQFTADITTTVAGQTTPMKVWVDGTKSRNEVEQSGVKVTVITRGDLRKTYSLIPGQNQYMEMPLTEKQGLASRPGSDSDWTALGTEKVNDINCNKYKVTTPNPANPQQTITSIFYFDAANRKPVKAIVGEGGNSMLVEYRNFEAAAPDSSLFEIPSGYTKLTIPGFQTPANPVLGGQ